MRQAVTKRSKWYPAPFCNPHPCPIRTRPKGEEGKTNAESVVLPVDDDGGDVLVHEGEDGEEGGGQGGGEGDVPVQLVQRVDEPGSRNRRLPTSPISCTSSSQTEQRRRTLKLSGTLSWGTSRPTAKLMPDMMRMARKTLKSARIVRSCPSRLS